MPSPQTLPRYRTTHLRKSIFLLLSSTCKRFKGVSLRGTSHRVADKACILEGFTTAGKNYTELFPNLKPGHRFPYKSDVFTAPPLRAAARGAPARQTNDETSAAGSGAIG